MILYYLFIIFITYIVNTYFRQKKHHYSILRFKKKEKLKKMVGK